jgi:hypothetical protein
MAETDAEIVRLLARLALRVTLGTPDWKRLRIAVTPEEMAAVRRYCEATEGFSCDRIAGVPLVVEERPEAPDLGVVFAYGDNKGAGG